MKQDRLEKFIKDHREEFDDEIPSEGLWKEIEKSIPVNKEIKPKSWGVWFRAAAFFLLGALSWILINYFINKKDTSTGNAKCLSSLNKVESNRKAIQLPVEIEVIPKQNPVNQTAYNKPKNSSTNQENTSEDFREIQAYYVMQISQKRSEIFRFASDQPDINKQIDIEFSQIDSAYKSLKSDLKDNIDNREVIEAMILNYRIRIEMLDVILEQLKESSDEPKEKYKKYEI
jgi:hypothetical protein